MRLSLRVRKLYANVAAFKGKNKAERHKIRRKILGGTRDDDTVVTHHTDVEIFKLTQDRTFPLELTTAKKIIVMVVPEHNAMSGGIYSFFSIVEQMRRLRREHGYHIITVTRPNSIGETYFRNTNFRNSENVYRFSQIPLCLAAEEIYLQVPEYAVASFYEDLSEDEKFYLSGRRVKVNILNQNVQLMPERDQFRSIYSLTSDVTQSVAHHAYFSQAYANRYQLPTLLLPAYTDLSQYPSCGFGQKDKLIIYSLDEARHKAACLEQIKVNFPDFELIEIKGIPFDKFMELATRCTFSITFGEGFDGYLAQPIIQGGIGFAVYNDDFFPSRHFLDYKSIFSSPDEMVSQICEVMKELLADPAAYTALNAAFAAEYDRLYSVNDYVARIRKLTLGQFELFPEGWKS